MHIHVHVYKCANVCSHTQNLLTSDRRVLWAPGAQVRIGVTLHFTDWLPVRLPESASGWYSGVFFAASVLCGQACVGSGECSGGTTGVTRWAWVVLTGVTLAPGST